MILTKEALKSKLWYRILRVLFAGIITIGIILTFLAIAFDNRYYSRSYIDYSKSYYECIPNNSNEKFYLDKNYVYPEADNNNKFDPSTDLYVKNKCLQKTLNEESNVSNFSKESVPLTQPSTELGAKNLEPNYKITIVEGHRDRQLSPFQPFLTLFIFAFLIRTLFLFVITRKFI